MYFICIVRPLQLEKRVFRKEKGPRGLNVVDWFTCYGCSNALIIDRVPWEAARQTVKPDRPANSQVIWCVGLYRVRRQRPLGNCIYVLKEVRGTRCRRT